jgi:uncharacterized protein
MIALCLFITKMSNQTEKNKDVKLLLLAGIIAAGVFASAFGSMQLLGANAQEQNSTDDDPMPVDLGCETGATVCEDEHKATTHTVISTAGAATVKVSPDKFTVTVGVETNGTTAEEAASRNADLTAQVIAALKALGISEDEISTSSYSVYPVYSQSDPVNACMVLPGNPVPPECYVTGEIVSYRASNSISVTLDADGDISAGEVIDAAIEDGKATSVSGAYFFLSQERQLEVQEKLIEDAIANARHRAELAASAVGAEISGVKSINLNDVFFPPIFYARAEELSSTQILPGRQEVTMTVSVVYFAKSSGPDESDPNVNGYIETARSFIKSKLPGLGIEIDDEFDLHTDMVVHISENELHIDYGVVDTNGGVHDGHIEVVNNEVTVATLDGKSIM